jgi:curved DNA-binding protein CbpA
MRELIGYAGGAMEDLYRLLGLSRRANGALIKSTYCRLAKRFHPDTNFGRENERIREINHAYETLGDPANRASYDALLRAQRAKTRRLRFTMVATGTAAFAATLTIGFVWLKPAIHGEAPQPELVAATTTAIGKTRVPDTMSDCSVSQQEDHLSGDAVDSRWPTSKECLSDARLAMERGLIDLLPADNSSQYDEGTHQKATSFNTIRAMQGHEVSPKSWVVIGGRKRGFQLSYPADVFLAKGGGTADDNRLLVSVDGRALMRVYFVRNRMATTPSQVRTSLLATRYAGATLDHAVRSEFWFVLSGTLGDEMFYERVIFSCDRQSFHGWLMTYPVAERQIYDALVDQINRTYHHSWSEDWRCAGAGDASIIGQDGTDAGQVN